MLSLLSGPQDPSQLDATINNLIENINAAFFGGSAAANNQLTLSQTFGTTAPGTTREIYGKILLNYAGTVTTGSMVGVRGEVSGASGTTLSDGFYSGVQGKFILGGATVTEAAAARYSGVFAQLDMSSGTMTAGQIQALWADMGASAANAFDAETNIVRATNTTAQTVNAIMYGYGKATYIFDLSTNGGTSASTTASVGTTASGGWLKVLVNGAVRYVPLAITQS